MLSSQDRLRPASNDSSRLSDRIRFPKDEYANASKLPSPAPLHKSSTKPDHSSYVFIVPSPGRACRWAKSMHGKTPSMDFDISSTSSNEPSIADLPIVSGRIVTGLPALRNSSTQPFKRGMATFNTSAGGFLKIRAGMKDDVGRARQISIMSSIHQAFARLRPFIIVGVQVDEIRRVHADRHILFR